MDAAFAIPNKGTINPDGSASKIESGMRYVPEGLPNAQDMSRHLNAIATRRTPNQLKELYRYATIPGMIPMAGGIPSPENFPYEELSAQIFHPDHLPLDNPRSPSEQKKGLFDWLFGKKKLQTITIPKYVPNAKPEDLQLATSLQYQAATGPPSLPLFLRKYVETIYKPAYADWDVLINVGNTDGWNKICGMLIEEGDGVLVEEWTYPAAENAFIPLGTAMVPIKMDGEGVTPEHMEEVLGGWDVQARGGMKRPKIFYTIPTGQNPTGATMGFERKKAIYEICRKYDVIICEDEPYYCLFTGKWTPKGHESEQSTMAERQIALEKEEGKEGNEAFIKALPSTYLTHDYEGRVIRMDTFSKTACPGSRLGWFTSSPVFIERLTRITESGTQAPSGFVTAMTTAMINRWGFDGYIRWLRGIKATYRMRRNWICDAFQDHFHLEFEENTNGVVTNPLVKEVYTGLGRGVTCYAKPASGTTEAKWDEKRGLSSKKGPALISFLPPTAGMFIWLGIHLAEHPDYDALVAQGEDAERLLMEKLWHILADNLVLFAPGWAFDGHGPHAIGGKGVGYFRLAYSTTTYEQTQDSAKILAKVLTKFYRL